MIKLTVESDYGNAVAKYYFESEDPPFVATDFPDDTNILDVEFLGKKFLLLSVAFQPKKK